jgi:hypothetical protein
MQIGYSLNDIRNTGWLDSTQTHHLFLGKTRYMYQVFERVLLAVSSSLAINWKVLYKSQITDPIFPYLVVSLLLISNALQEYYSLTNCEINAILGDAHYQYILEYCNA